MEELGKLMELDMSWKHGFWMNTYYAINMLAKRQFQCSLIFTETILNSINICQLSIKILLKVPIGGLFGMIYL